MINAKTLFLKVWACLYDRTSELYQGKVNITERGEQCLNWTVKGPVYPAGSFPDNPVTNAENNCRNPTKNPGGPWCWLQSNPNKMGYCTIPKCRKSVYL